MILKYREGGRTVGLIDVVVPSHNVDGKGFL